MLSSVDRLSIMVTGRILSNLAVFFFIYCTDLFRIEFGNFAEATRYFLTGTA
jgi:hypothetical protein